MQQCLTHLLGKIGFEKHHFHGTNWREIKNLQTIRSRLV
jgi:hypothetical protein